MISDDEFIEKNNKIKNEISKLNKELIQIESNKESVSYYEKIISQIRESLTPKLDIKNNVGKYFNLFIDKVFVSKINNDRKHLKLQMVFNFKHNDEEVEIDMNNNSSGGSNSKLTTTNRDYNVRASFDNNFLKQKYLLLSTHESRFR